MNLSVYALPIDTPTPQCYPYPYGSEGAAQCARPERRRTLTYASESNARDRREERVKIPHGHATVSGEAAALCHWSAL